MILQQIKFTVIFLGLVIALSISWRVAAQDFKGIVPLVSTRADVEKILGKPNEFGRYELAEGRVYVSFFSTVGCRPEQKTCRCLAPPGTVSEVSVTFNDEILLSSLRLDPKKWIETPTDGHLLGEYTYFNEESGIAYHVLDGIVMDIVYYESSATCASLMKKTKMKEPANQSGSNNRGHACIPSRFW